MRTMVPGRQFKLSCRQLTAVEQREWEVDEELGCKRFPAVVFGVDDVVDLANGRGDKQAHQECADEVAVSPEPDVDRVQDTEEREAVRDAVNDEPESQLAVPLSSSLLAVVRELVQDHPEEEEVDQRPNPDRVSRGRHVGFLAVSTSMHVAADPRLRTVQRPSLPGAVAGVGARIAPLRHSHPHHGATLQPTQWASMGHGAATLTLGWLYPSLGPATLYTSDPRDTA